MPYFRDNFIPGINSVPERRSSAIPGLNLRNQDGDLLLFGRLANAGRARPRCFRLFNAHLD